VREVGWEALSESKAPLTLVVSRALGQYAGLLSYIALFATANTVLMFLIVPSRILYGMSSGGSLPAHFSLIGKRGTPYFSVALVGLAAAMMAYLADIKTVAQLTDMGVFIAYVAVNASLIALAGSALKRGFASPRVAGVPVLAWLGVLSAIAMLAFFPPQLWLMEAGILAVGAALFIAGRASRAPAAAGRISRQNKQRTGAGTGTRRAS
jgi:amino acid transporter